MLMSARQRDRGRCPQSHLIQLFRCWACTILLGGWQKKRRRKLRNVSGLGVWCVYCSATVPYRNMCSGDFDQVFLPVCMSLSVALFYFSPLESLSCSNVDSDDESFSIGGKTSWDQYRGSLATKALCGSKCVCL